MTTGLRAAAGARRGIIVVLVVAVWLAIAAFGGPAIGKLASVVSNDQATFLPKSAESVKANAEFAKFSDAKTVPAFLIISGSGVYDDAFGGQPAQPSQPDQQNGPPGSAYAAALIDKVTVGKTPLQDYLAKGQVSVVLPAKDKSGVMVVIPLDSAKANASDAQGISNLSSIVEAIRADTKTSVPGATVHLTGPAGYGADIGAAFAGIDGVLLLVALLAVLLILLIVYRAIAVPIIVLLSAMCALALGGGVVYLLAKSDVIAVNGQSQGILFILVIGAATDYGLLLVSRFREELQRTPSTVQAMMRAWRACLAPIAASAVTVIAGLLCLLLSDLRSNQGLGPVGAIGIGCAFIGAMTLLPALLLLGRWIFWPRVPHLQTDHQRTEEDQVSTGMWSRISGFVRRRPRRIWVVVAIILAGFCIAVPSFKASGTTTAATFLSDVDSVAGQHVLDTKFDAGAGSPIQILSPADKAAAVAAAAGNAQGIEKATVLDNEVDGNVIVNAIPRNPDDATGAVTAVRDAVHPIAPGKILVGGTEALRVDTIAASTHDLRTIVPVILLVVLLVLILLLRSIIAPLMLVIATVLSFGTALGLSALLFNHVFDYPGSDPAVPLMAFVFLVALGVDYSIFLMSRAREEVTAHGPTTGVTRALTLTGGVITSAGIVLAATFAALNVIPILFMVQIAFIVPVGVLLDTLVVRTLLVPALAIDLGRFTWWPSHLSKITPKHLRAEADA
ncbi:RND superfamily putative drug exporter [Antricoccus suffuscus]|uniref:RND superfamily putative drug exporter n=1 Tax=Antricoccus suffuscus TaxID=1629062 RepID=A0A2T0ZZ09_9ACTN|nr:MMPL family transporter [Antricoccus suffuscus]PRZ41583.1 RND superfamily putative drug exporter [Antricoccus suffuscus]